MTAGGGAISLSVILASLACLVLGLGVVGGVIGLVIWASRRNRR